MTKITASQARATASFHDRLRAAQARYGVRSEDAQRHREDAAKLRRRAQEMEPKG